MHERTAGYKERREIHEMKFKTEKQQRKINETKAYFQKESIILIHFKPDY